MCVFSGDRLPVKLVLAKAGNQIKNPSETWPTSSIKHMKNGKVVRSAISLCSECAEPEAGVPISQCEHKPLSQESWRANCSARWQVSHDTWYMTGDIWIMTWSHGKQTAVPCLLPSKQTPNLIVSPRLFLPCDHFIELIKTEQTDSMKTEGHIAMQLFIASAAAKLWQTRELVFPRYFLPNHKID